MNLDKTLTRTIPDITHIHGFNIQALSELFSHWRRSKQRLDSATMIPDNAKSPIIFEKAISPFMISRRG